MGYLGGDGCRAVGHERSVAELDEASAGLRCREVAGIFAARAEGQMTIAGKGEWAQIVDLDPAVEGINELGANRFGDEPQGETGPRAGKTRVLHVVSDIGKVPDGVRQRDAGSARHSHYSPFRRFRITAFSWRGCERRGSQRLVIQL